MTPIHDPHLGPFSQDSEWKEMQERINNSPEAQRLRSDTARMLRGLNTGVENKDALAMELGVPVLKDSGDRRKFESGAVRDRAAGKGRYDLMATQMLMRLARHYEAGAIKYADRNWEKGMPVSVYVDAAMRHLIKYLAGWNDEDHLAAVVWNVAAIMFMEDKMTQLMDLPEREALLYNDARKWVIEKEKEEHDGMTLEDVHEKYFPNKTIEELEKIMPTRPRRKK